MILEKDLTIVGAIGKPHGIKGELSCTFTSDSFEMENCGYFVLQIDGIFVPFFIDEYRTKGSATLLVKLNGINTEQEARELSNLKIFIPQKLVSDTTQQMDLNYFIGFELRDKKFGSVGTINDVDDSTENELFVVGEKLIPVSEEFIMQIDHNKRILHTQLPEGLLDL